MKLKGLDIMKIMAEESITDKARFIFSNGNYSEEIEYCDGCFWCDFRDKKNKKSLFEAFPIQYIMKSSFELLPDEEEDYVTLIMKKNEEIKELQKECDDICSTAISVAFDNVNEDTELLLRKLLKYKKIKFEDGVYKELDELEG